MFVAGHETTATALGWMFYYLATLPDIQQKLKEEVDRVLKGQPITQDNIREVRICCILDQLEVEFLNFPF